MNQFAPEVFVERIDRLLVGLEIVDGLSNLRVTEPIRVVREIGRRRLPRKLSMRRDLLLDGTEGQVPLVRHETCVYSLFEGEIIRERAGDPVAPGALPPELVIRVCDPFRRYVARRLSVDLTRPKPIYILNRNIPGEPLLTPFQLCPGVAASIQSRSTMVHGRVLVTSQPARWARLELRQRSLNGTGALLGVAHGDDRGEYLLLVDARAGTVGALAQTLDLELVIYVHNPPPVPAAQKAIDPFWDLPIDVEPLAQTATGVTVNGDYGTPPVRRNITIQTGRDTRFEVALP